MLWSQSISFKFRTIDRVVQRSVWALEELQNIHHQPFYLTRRQQVVPDFPFPGHISELWLGNTKTFPGPGSALGPSFSWTCLTHLNWPLSLQRSSTSTPSLPQMTELHILLYPGRWHPLLSLPPFWRHTQPQAVLQVGGGPTGCRSGPPSGLSSRQGPWTSCGQGCSISSLIIHGVFWNNSYSGTEAHLPWEALWGAHGSRQHCPCAPS